MISIVTAYYNRRKLFERTLQSIKNTNYKGSFEVVAIDDASDESERLEDLIQEFPFLKIIRLEKKNKWYINSCIPFNIGFKKAKGDKIIIQNPECLHYDDILDFVDKNLDDNNYLSFACFSLDKSSTENLDRHLAKGNISKIIDENNRIVQYDGDVGWYNHSFFRPEAFHFCSAITKINLANLGGFDEVFSLGIGYDDNEFIFRIKKKGLLVRFIDDIISLHQNHYKSILIGEKKQKYQTELAQKNKKLLYNYTYKNTKIESNKISRLLDGNFKYIFIKAKRNLIYNKYKIRSLFSYSFNLVKRFTAFLK